MSTIKGLAGVRVSTNNKRPGLKPGQRHSGQFKSGFDPRRNTAGPFVSEKKRSFMQACKDLTPNALETLEDAMNDPQASWRDRMTAATLIIEHAHGKPVDRAVIATLTEDTGHNDGRGLSMDELHKIASGAVVVRDSEQEG